MSKPTKRVKIEHNGSIHETPVMLDETSLMEGMRKVALQVAEWSGESATKPLQIISALNGAKPFTTDITKELARLGVKTDVHEIKISNTMGTRGAVAPVIEYGQIPKNVLKGSKTLIVDDIIDTGGTMSFIKEIIAGCPAEVRVASVVNKYAAFSDMSDFTIYDCRLEKEKMLSCDGKNVDYWFFGYGMDLDGKYRDLREISWLEVER